MKEFIETHTALNHRELCRLIDWSPSSFNQWRKGIRGIPDDKANYHNPHKIDLDELLTNEEKTKLKEELKDFS